MVYILRVAPRLRILRTFRSTRLPLTQSRTAVQVDHMVTYKGLKLPTPLIVLPDPTGVAVLEPKTPILFGKMKIYRERVELRQFCFHLEIIVLCLV